MNAPIRVSVTPLVLIDYEPYMTNVKHLCFDSLFKSLSFMGGFVKAFLNVEDHKIESEYKISSINCL